LRLLEYQRRPGQIRIRKPEHKKLVRIAPAAVAPPRLTAAATAATHKNLVFTKRFSLLFFSFLKRRAFPRRERFFGLQPAWRVNVR